VTAEQNTYADKIAKLLAKAEDAGVTPEEAEVFFSKAQELMTKWSIDEAMIRAAGRGEDPSKVIELKIHYSTQWAGPLSELCAYIAQRGACKPLFMKAGNRTTVFIVGLEEDVRRVEQLNSSLQIQALAALTRWWAEHQDEYQFESKGRQWRARREFLHGFGSGVNRKLGEAVEAAEAAARAEETETGPSVALVLRDKGEQIDSFIAAQYGRLRSGRSSSREGNREANSAGHAAGRQANTSTSRGVGGGRGSLPRGA